MIGVGDLVVCIAEEDSWEDCAIYPYPSHPRKNEILRVEGVHEHPFYPNRFGLTFAKWPDWVFDIGAFRPLRGADLFFQELMRVTVRDYSHKKIPEEVT